LQQLAQDPDLEPRDILVMAPDIESYAPYIAAVFDGETLEKQKIPFSIADRSRQKESPVAEAFLKVLALKGARLTASQILELLEEPTIRNRFDLSLEDLDLVRQMVNETHICWGIDGAFKERFDLPPLDNNSWKAGFDRLFLGFALPADEKALFEGILPYDGVEGSASAVLGNFYAFCDQLFKTIESFNQSRSIAEWGELLSNLVEEFFQTDAKDELITLLRQLQKLEQIEGLSGYAEGIDFEVLRCILQGELSLASTSGFLRGGVTFCSLLPMRSIPFKVVALLGMNDAAFPRRSPSVSFDLMTQEPQKGDPSRRQEDRYLFLEAILSARNALIISYIGQSVKDNSEAPPSVVVCELLDALDQGFKMADADNVRKRIVTRHRLQGFNPAYFSADPRLFSYSHDNYQGALALVSQKKQLLQRSDAADKDPNAFMQGEITVSEDNLQTVTLAQLVKFIQNPSQFFLRNQLGIFLNKESDALQDQEPFSLDGLSNYQISQELVEQILADDVSPQLFEIYLAKSILPQGSLAAPTFEKCMASARAFASKVQAFTKGKQPESLSYDQTFDGIRLLGELSGLYPQGLLRHRCASIKPKDRLSTWIHHLAACSIADVGSIADEGSVTDDDAQSAKSYLLGSSSKDLTYGFVDDSRQLLTELLKLFQAGLLRPLPFFPKAAFSYCEEDSKGKAATKCLDKARAEWLGSDRSMGECKDADFDYCFGRLDPIDEEFVRLAQQIVEPLLNNESEA
ncbi:MAG: exodeoxyribonuclease V subunit gamma, partial [Desulfuromonadales bacterium]|nr:exodeoxyribonuclease V subunit gamma [Desulfuromonadales bacterium]